MHDWCADKAQTITVGSGSMFLVVRVSSITGGAGNDNLNGNDGKDTIGAGGGSDTITGGLVDPNRRRRQRHLCYATVSNRSQATDNAGAFDTIVVSTSAKTS